MCRGYPPLLVFSILTGFVAGEWELLSTYLHLEGQAILRLRVRICQMSGNPKVVFTTTKSLLFAVRSKALSQQSKESAPLCEPSHMRGGELMQSSCRPCLVKCRRAQIHAYPGYPPLIYNILTGFVARGRILLSIYLHLDFESAKRQLLTEM